VFSLFSGWILVNPEILQGNQPLFFQEAGERFSGKMKQKNG
jgi:hypothetical protein